MQHLSRQKSSHVETFMRKDLWRMLGMVNEKYGTITHEKLLKINSKYTKFEVRNFYMRSNQKLEKILVSALNNLKNRYLIEWELLTIINTNVSGREEWIVANDNQKKEIMLVKRDVLTDMGYNNAYQVAINNREEEFFEKVNSILNKKHGWNYFFKRYKIIFDAKNIQKAIPETEIELNRILLNQEIISYLNKEAQSQYDKIEVRYNEIVSNAYDDYDEYLRRRDTWKFPDNYVLIQGLLADELIKIDGNDKLLPEQISTEDENADIEQFFALNLAESDDLNIYKPIQ